MVLSRLKLLAIAGVALAGSAVALTSLTPQPVYAEMADRPVVVELFTSQSCYSCPPAEAFLGDLIEERDDVIALEWHVDYWDKLFYRGSVWKDVFSDPAFTARQRGYASRMPRGQSYTPQMVIDGKREAVGSRRDDVYKAIAAVADEPRLSVSATKRKDGTVDVAVEGSGESAAVWVITFLKARTTNVEGGENNGKALANHHIVRNVDRIGDWSGQSLRLPAPVDLDADHDCVVLVQSDDQGPILGAARCAAEDATSS